MAPRALCLRLQNVSQPAQRSQLILVRQHCGTICTVLAPSRIGLAPIKPCTLIFPMGFGALIQISLSTNSTSSISGSRTKKQSHCKLFLGGEPFQSIDSTQGMMALHPAKHLCRKYLLFHAPNPLKTSETNCLGRKYLAH